MSNVHDAPAYGNPPGQAAAPSSVLNAVKLMFARAALTLLGIITTFGSTNAIRDQVRTSQPNVSQATLDTAVNVALGVAVVFGLIYLVLYLLLALQVRKGKNWARIVTFVVAALGLIGALTSLAQPASGLSRILALITAVIDAGIIYLLAQKSSAAYFQRPAQVLPA